MMQILICLAESVCSKEELCEVGHGGVEGHPLRLFAGSALPRCELSKITQNNSALCLVGH